jgi:hypothetical protein
MKAKKGNCYSTAARALLGTNPLGRWLKTKGWLDTAVLVHGVVSGQGPLEGRRIGHAWVEANGLAIDWSNGKRLALPAWVYRAAARCGDEVVTYDTEQATILLVKTRHFGPWDEKIERGDHS